MSEGRHFTSTTSCDVRLRGWIDIGYFRDLEGDNKEYCLLLPPSVTKSAVLFNQLTVPDFSLTPHDIFYKNFVWVGGGMFVAARDVMLKFCDEYQRAATFFLTHRQLSSTDQQTLYASMTYEGRRDVNLTVDIQVEPGEHDWFDLGLSVLREIDS
ncbi:uncharacterized protein LOC112569141 [Pomacea canaliculata]|uniref:uncharacterized protein LOC112569141 n=1 Tax=Pomacea canaliculata TaxID=400727 RepID=UPI000D72AB85|nr:uncharacterized protein LOC112569141 [Pomacea canaliculata]XP_025102627.1 uncharacterized protein LOC112569141 [Pomacea canaliculata]